MSEQDMKGSEFRRAASKFWLIHWQWIAILGSHSRGVDGYVTELSPDCRQSVQPEAGVCESEALCTGQHVSGGSSTLITVPHLPVVRMKDVLQSINSMDKVLSQYTAIPRKEEFTRMT